VARVNDADLIEAVERLHLEPGDRVIVRCAKPISREQAEQLLEFARDHIPDHDVLVLAEGITLEVEH
jgi:hypothetical protein